MSSRASKKRANGPARAGSDGVLVREHARSSGTVREYVRSAPSAAVQGARSLSGALDTIAAGVREFQAVMGETFAAAPEEAQALLAPLVARAAQHAQGLAACIGEIERLARGVRELQGGAS